LNSAGSLSLVQKLLFFVMMMDNPVPFKMDGAVADHLRAYDVET